MAEYDRRQRQLESTLQGLANQIQSLQAEHEALCRCLHQGGLVSSSRLSEELQRGVSNVNSPAKKAGRFMRQGAVTPPRQGTPPQGYPEVASPAVFSRPQSASKERPAVTGAIGSKQQIQQQMQHGDVQPQQFSKAQRRPQQRAPQEQQQQRPEQQNQRLQQAQQQRTQQPQSQQQTHAMPAQASQSPRQPPSPGPQFSQQSQPRSQQPQSHQAQQMHKAQSQKLQAQDAKLTLNIASSPCLVTESTVGSPKSPTVVSPRGITGQQCTPNRPSPRSAGASGTLMALAGLGSVDVLDNSRQGTQSSKELHDLVFELCRGGTSLNHEDALKSLQQTLKKPGALQTWKGEASPLVMAVKAGRVDLARTLLRAQANPNDQTDNGVSILHLTTYESDLEMSRTLIVARAESNGTDRFGQTPIFFAADTKVCRLLMEAAADLSILNSMGQSALHLAALAGLGEVFTWLSKRMHQSLVRLKDIHQISASQYAHESGILRLDGSMSSAGISNTIQSKATKRTVPVAKSKEPGKPPDMRRRTIKTELLNRQAKAAAAEDAIYQDPVELQQGLVAKLFDDGMSEPYSFTEMPPLASPGVCRFTPKEAAGPGRPKSDGPDQPSKFVGGQAQAPVQHPMGTSQVKAAPDHGAIKEQLRGQEKRVTITVPGSSVPVSPTGNKTESEAVLVLQSAARGFFAREHSKNIRRSKNGQAFDVRVEILPGGDLGFRVVQRHCGAPLSVDRVDQSRAQLYPLQDGDVILAVDDKPVSEMDDFKQAKEDRQRARSFRLTLQRPEFELAAQRMRTSTGGTSTSQRYVVAEAAEHEESVCGTSMSSQARGVSGLSEVFTNLGVMEEEEVDDWARTPPHGSKDSGIGAHTMNVTNARHKGEPQTARRSIPESEFEDEQESTPRGTRQSLRESGGISPRRCETLDGGITPHTLNGALGDLCGLPGEEFADDDPSRNSTTSWPVDDDDDDEPLDGELDDCW